MMNEEQCEKPKLITGHTALLSLTQTAKLKTHNALVERSLNKYTIGKRTFFRSIAFQSYYKITS
jgi:hypothetical protein